MAKLVIKTDGLPAETIKLKGGVNRLGRSSSNDFQIEHPTISRFHCEIEVKENAMFVRDLDSSNGTFVNEQPVDTAQLETGHILRIGDVKLEVMDAPQPAKEGNMPACCNHPTHPASMECTQCHRVFCGACVHILRRTGGKILRLCPSCSGHCQPLQGLGQNAKRPFGNLLSKLLGKKTLRQSFHE